jgi:hypothetical protein
MDRLGFVVSDPFAMGLRMDGAQAPAVRQTTLARQGFLGIPPIRDRAANGWGTEV